MPVVFVHGMPNKGKPTNTGSLFTDTEYLRWQERLNLLIEDVQVAIASIKELGVTKDEISIFFPLDIVAKGLGKELICFVHPLKKAERTPEILKKMTDAVRDRLVDFVEKNLPRCELIEVFPQPIDVKPEDVSDWRRPESG